MPPNAMVHNIVIGRTWVDAFGPLNIHCDATGAKCVLDFTPCGWFSYGRYEFSGFIIDKGERPVELHLQPALTRCAATHCLRYPVFVTGLGVHAQLAF